MPENRDLLERWLDKAIPPEPRADFEARLIAQGRAAVAAQCRSSSACRSRSRRPLFVAAAALLVFALVAFAIERARPASEQHTEHALILAVPDETRFELDAGARFRHAPRSLRLEIIEGTVTAHAARSPLVVGFPAGELRVESGAARTEVIAKGSSEMSPRPDAGSGRSARRAVVATVLLTLVGGAAWYEIEGESGALEPGATKEFAIELDRETGRQIAVPVSSGRSASTGPETAPPAGGTATAPSVGTEAPSATDNATSAAPLLAPLQRGLVLDAATGEPIAGAHVAWVQTWIPEGVMGYALRNTQSKESIHLSSVLQLAASARERGLDIGLSPPYSESDLSVLRAQCSTDADGAFALSVRAATGDYLRVRADGYSAAAWDDFPPASEDGVSILRLHPAQIVRGKLLDECGRPLTGNPRVQGYLGFRVPCVGSDEWVLETRVDIDGQGGFEFEVGNAKEIRVAGFVMGYEDFDREITLVTGPNEITLTLAPAPHIAGRVIDETGQPLVGATILVHDYERSLFGGRSERMSSMQSGEDGTFRANIEYESNIDVSVSLDGYAARKLEKLKLADSPFEIVLVRAERGSISGVVLDEDGNPLAGAEVNAISEDMGSRMIVVHHSRATTDAAGAFRLEGLNAGTYTLRVRGVVEPAPAEGSGIAHLGATRAGVVVEAGTETQGVEIAFVPGATIWGFVLDGESRPRGGVEVTLYRPDLLGGEHEQIAKVDADPDGRFEFRGVPPGSYAAALEAEGLYTLVSASGRGTFEAHLGGEMASVVGVVTRRGAALGGASVALGRFDGATLRSARFGSASGEGRFEIGDLAAGRYVIQARDPSDGAALIRFFDLGAAKQELQLEWPTGAIAGSAKGASGGPARAVALDVIEIDGVRLEGVVPATNLRLLQVACAADGVFLLDGVAAGRYRISVVDEPGSSIEVEFDGTRLEVDIPRQP